MSFYGFIIKIILKGIKSMKALVRRLVCICVAFLLCLTSLPLIMRAAEADGEEPELSARSQVIVSQEGIDASFGTAYNELHANTKIVLSSAVDLSAEDYFEFNVYVEDADALKSVISGYSGEEEQGLLFAFGSAARETNFARRNYATVDITKQIIKSGWNNIKVNKSDFAENSINWSGVKYTYLRFGDYNAENEYTALENRVVKLRNICSAFSVPDVPENSTPLYSEILKNTLGENEESTFEGISKRFTIKELPAADFSKADIISLDIKLSDYNALNNTLTENSFGLDLILYSENGSANIPVWSALKAGEYTGWYRADVLVSSIAAEAEFDYSAICGFSIAVSGENTDISLAGDYALQMYVTNVCARAIPDITYDTTYGVEISDFVVEKTVFVAGEIYSDFKVSENGAFEAVGNAEFIELDIYISDYASFINSFKKDAAGNDVDMSLEFTVSNNEEDLSNTLTWSDLQDKVICKGWNHIILPISEALNSDFDASDSIAVWKLNITGDFATSKNPYSGKTTAVANIAATKYQTPEAQYINDVMSLMSKDGKTRIMGNNFIRAEVNEYHIANPADFTEASYIEFDFYVQNFEAYKAKMAEQGITNITFRVSSDEKTYAYSSKRNTFSNQITHSGWNHIKLSYSGFSNGSQGTLDETKVDSWQMYYNGSRTTAVTEELEGQYMALTNIAATGIVDPVLPENVIAQLGTAKTNTLGNYFHYTQDRIYEEKITPVDFSLGPVVEFDLYVDDYEALMDAVNSSERDSRVGFYVSSTAPALWSQYTKPRSYYNAVVDITDKITKSGWNHIELGKADFEAVNHVVDWSGLTAWKIGFLNSSNYYPEKNPATNVAMRICNIVNTGIVANIPKDGEKEKQPDNEAVYISTADALSDANGTWNPSTVTALSDYKTEGEASISFAVDYTSDVNDAKAFYLLDETADMSDLKTLKLDFFIDLPDNIKKNGNTIEVVLADSRNANKDYYYWNVDVYSLEQGWNSLSFDLVNASKNGNPDLKEIKSVYIRFTELNLSKESYEEILVAVDNLRYISSMGNKTLKIKSDEVIEENIINNNDNINDVVDTTIPEDEKISEDTVIPEDTVILEDKEIGINKDTVSLQGKTKYVKNIKKIIKIDYLTAGIILGVETIVFAAAAIVFIIIYRKKQRKQ